MKHTHIIVTNFTFPFSTYTETDKIKYFESYGLVYLTTENWGHKFYSSDINKLSLFLLEYGECVTKTTIYS